MVWGSKAEALAPASLRENIREEAEIMTSRYESPIMAEKSPPYDRMYDYPFTERLTYYILIEFYP